MRVAISAAVMALSASAAAAEIHWTGDSACRRELEVAEQVTSMIGRDLFSIDGMVFELDVQPAHDGTWHLELKTLGPTNGERSSRSLQGKSCVELTDAAAVAIALAIGPQPGPTEAQIGAKPADPPVAREVGAAEPRAKPATLDTPSASSLVWFGALAGALDTSVPLNTVYTRLRSVRADFRAALERHRGDS